MLKALATALIVESGRRTRWVFFFFFYYKRGENIVGNLRVGNFIWSQDFLLYEKTFWGKKKQNKKTAIEFFDPMWGHLKCLWLKTPHILKTVSGAVRYCDVTSKKVRTHWAKVMFWCRLREIQWCWGMVHGLSYEQTLHIFDHHSLFHYSVWGKLTVGWSWKGGIKKYLRVLPHTLVTSEPVII